MYVVGTYVSVIFVPLTFPVTTTKPVGVVAKGEELDPCDTSPPPFLETVGAAVGQLFAVGCTV